MPNPSYLSRRSNLILYGCSGLLWLSGVAWLCLQWRAGGSDFGQPPGAAACLQVHGAMAMLFLAIFGFLWGRHIVPGWAQVRRRSSGGLLVLASAILASTGWGLYYLSDDIMRRSTAWVHGSLGVGVPLALAWHVLTRRKKSSTSLNESEEVMPAFKDQPTVSTKVAQVATANPSAIVSPVPFVGGRLGLRHLKLFLVVLGPGLVVMLADTDAGSVITAAQSGAQWGYKLLALQLLLVPVLYVIQELTVRLGIFSGKGHGELIRDTFGPGWAWLSVAGLAVACFGALITEFAGIAGAGSLFGISRLASVSVAGSFLLVVVWTGSYRRVERIAIALGLFELAFVWVAFHAPIQGSELVRDLSSLPRKSEYWYLVSANIGAVIMPWMVFYQQSAVTDKKLKPEHYSFVRWDTAIGALLTQIIMAAVLITVASTLGTSHPDVPLDSVGGIAQALTPSLGVRLGQTFFGLGIIGAAMVASIVVSLAIAWGFGELTGYKHSLEHAPREAPWFYTVFTLAVVGGAAAVLLAPNLVTLSVAVQVMNALLLPLVLGFLVALAVKALPPERRLKGPYFWFVLVVVIVTSGLGVFGGLSGL